MPQMNLFTKKNRIQKSYKMQRDKVDINEKILKTTRETEKLKRELEELMAKGQRGNSNLSASKPNFAPESTSRDQILKSYDPKHSKNNPEPAKGKSNNLADPNVESSKKYKGYNVEEAQLYIKKQKDKRLETLKNKKSETKASSDLKKEKLKELQQTARDLVKKNVEAQRLRSKSREPPIVRSRSVSRDKKDPNKSIVLAHMCAERSRGFPQSLILEKQVPNQSSKKQEVVNSDRFRQGSRSHFDKHLTTQKNGSEIPETTSGNNFGTNFKLEYKKSEVPFDSRLEPTTSKHASALEIHEKKCGISETLDIPSNANPLDSNIPTSNKEFNDKIVIQSNITLRSANRTEPSNLNLTERKIASDWFKETSPDGDPLNFINTFRRQLNYLTSDKKASSVDVAVQSSLSDDKKESNFNKSFSLPRCLNLDPNTVEHIELKGLKSEIKDGPTKTKHSKDSEAESSNTSKNIPSISSDLDLRQNAFKKMADTSVSCKPILEKNVEKVKKRIFSDSDDYSSDFVTTNLSKSRNSIISFNCAKVSPSASTNKVPLIASPGVINIKSPELGSTITKSSEKKSPQTSSSVPMTSMNFWKNKTFIGDTGQTSDHKQSEKSESLHSSKLKTLESPQFQSLYTELEPSSTVNSEMITSRKSQCLDSDKHSSNYKLNVNRTPTPKIILSDSYRSDTLLEGASPEVINIKSPELRSTITKSSEKKSPQISSSVPMTSMNFWKNRTFIGVTDQTSEHKQSEKPESLHWSKLKTLESPQFQTLYAELEPSSTVNSEMITSRKSQCLDSDKHSSNYKLNVNRVPTPKIILSDSYRSDTLLEGKAAEESSSQEDIQSPITAKKSEKISAVLTKNISVRSNDKNAENLANTNEIHLKFEAEIHLLNDFNESLKHFSEIEKAFESIRVRNDSDVVTKKILQNRDTQTSIINNKTSTSVSSSLHNDSQISTINYSRGCGRASELHRSDIISSESINSELDKVFNEEYSGDFDTLISENTSVVVDHSLIKQTEWSNENSIFRNCAGVSLSVFDQLIKDEDARIENWRKVVKIREQTLLDRVRGELVWLEMQKKELIQNDKLSEASLIKKKQRGILLKHQQERHEMHRLKQMQKEESAKRKNLLKNQRNFIKEQLHSDKMLSKRRPSIQAKEKRKSGPLKMVALNQTLSENSISKQSIIVSERNITSSSSVVKLPQEPSDHVQSEIESLEMALTRHSTTTFSNIKKTLLMREQALAQRRKTVEELLEWHKKLLEEEKAIEKLENRVENIISKLPSEEQSKQKKDLTGKTLTSMSQSAFERLQSSTSHISSRSTSASSNVSKNIPQEKNISGDSSKTASTNYTTEFDVESVPENIQQDSEDQSSISSISQLIEDFSKIGNTIISLNSQTKPSPNDTLPTTENDDSNSASEVVSEISSKVEVKSHQTNNEDNQEEHQNLHEELQADPTEIEKDREEKTPLNKETPEDNLIETPNESAHTVPELPNTTSTVGSIETESKYEESEHVSNNNIGNSSPSSVKEDTATSRDDNQMPTKEEGEVNVVTELEKVPTEGEEMSNVQNKSLVEEQLPQYSAQSNSPRITKNEPSVPEEDNQETHSDASTSKQFDEIEEYTTSHVNISSALPQPEEQTLLSTTEHSLIIPEEIQAINKTDEEKAASLSCKSLINQNSHSLEKSFGAELPSPETTSASIATEENDASLPSTSNQPSPKEQPSTESSCSLDKSQKYPQKTIVSSGKSQKPPTLDIKKRVQEILSEPSPISKEDKKEQDYCNMTYDLRSPTQSPELASPIDDMHKSFLGNEAEELFRKQLAVEQEIKMLTEQQAFFIREIPNKPPPPYTPPSKTKLIKTRSFIPNTKEEIEQITEYSAKIIHKAYLSNNLTAVNISDNTLNLIVKNIDKGFYKYAFDVCKEIAIDHYSQFLEAPGPSWFQADPRTLIPTKPLDAKGLKKLMSEKLLELFGFQKPETRRENTIMKWSRKKRDDVDEVLVKEMQNEESSWTTYDKEEQLVKDRLTTEILNNLLRETAAVLQDCIRKKTGMS